MKYLLLTTVLLSLYSNISVAVTGEILDNDIATGADVSVLRAEAELFETIRQGVMLTLTECELEKSCSLNVNQDELHQLVEKLDARITSIAIRHSESGEEGLEDVLLTYVDARDGYNEMLDKLATLPQIQESEANEFVEGDTFSDDVKQDSAGTQNKEGLYNDLFEDIDEDL